MLCIDRCIDPITAGLSSFPPHACGTIHSAGEMELPLFTLGLTFRFHSLRDGDCHGRRFQVTIACNAWAPGLGPAWCTWVPLSLFEPFGALYVYLGRQCHFPLERLTAGVPQHLPS